MGAASGGDCEDFADGVVGWIFCEGVEERKSRFLASLGMTLFFLPNDICLRWDGGRLFLVMWLETG
jgi:hypothetical protein